MSSRRLEDCFEEALLNAQNEDGPVCFGELKDFNRLEVGNSPLKFVIRNQNLFLTHSSSRTHGHAAYQAVYTIICSIRNSILGKQFQFRSYTEGTFKELPLLFGCTAKATKTFDGVIEMASLKPRYHPLLVIEVAFRHETERILLEEGASFLSQYTDTQFSLLIQLIEAVPEGKRSKQVASVRIVLLERGTEHASESRLLGKATKKDCLDLPTEQMASAKNIADLVNAIVHFDKIFEAKEIMRPDFEAKLELPCAGIYSYYGDDSITQGPNDRLTIDIGHMLKEIMEYVEEQVHKKIYPF